MAPDDTLPTLPSPLSPPPPPARDARIARRVREMIRARAEGTEAIRITVRSGTVRLQGFVRDETTAEEACHLASCVRGVREVRCELQVGAPPPTAAA